MSLLNWIFDIYQHTQIDKARDDAAQVREELASVRRAGGGVDSERLLVALEELALATKAMQRLIVEKGVATRGELEVALRLVDQEDGREDGRTPLG